MTRLNFLQSLIKRALWWIWTGGTIGAYCGIIAGALHGFVVTILAFVLTSAITLFSPASVLALNGLDDVVWWISIIALGAFAGAVCGAMAGGIIGAMNFFVLSCAPHRFQWPELVNEPAERIRRVALRSSFVGAFCAATSAFLLFVVLRNVVDLSVVVAIYAVGASGGFTVGLFVGARNIVRDDAVRESSTR